MTLFGAARVNRDSNTSKDQSSLPSCHKIYKTGCHDCMRSYERYSKQANLCFLIEVRVVAFSSSLRARLGAFVFRCDLPQTSAHPCNPEGVDAARKTCRVSFACKQVPSSTRCITGSSRSILSWRLAFHGAAAIGKTSHWRTTSS